jgi:UrcA family protein
MMTPFSRRTAAVLSGATVSLFIGSAAYGQIIVQAPAANVRIERVGYYDINLATRAGEHRLYRRVNDAVERVCLHDQGRWYGLAEPDYSHCADRAWRGARPQMIGAVYRARLHAYGNGY